MQSRIKEQTNIRKFKQAAHTLQIGAYMAMSVLPHNALAFESALSVSPSQALVADIRIEREGNVATSKVADTSRTQAVIAYATPITTVSELPPKKVAVVNRVYPSLDTPIVLEGEASYYSRAGCLGCNPLMIMANGQPLNDNALTMAIGADKKHLVGYKARVTSLATGKSVVATITDTGGFYKEKYGHRVADLTVATKQAIGMKGGVGQVRVEVF